MVEIEDCRCGELTDAETKALISRSLRNRLI
jgi:hypothetical protein